MELRCQVSPANIAVGESLSVVAATECVPKLSYLFQVHSIEVASRNRSEVGYVVANKKKEKRFDVGEVFRLR
jgi:hypothetical protein